MGSPPGGGGGDVSMPGRLPAVTGRSNKTPSVNRD